MEKSLSIVIPNYNGKHLLERYLPSVLTATAEAGVPFEIIVVDDKSTDGSAAYLRTAYPSIILLENESNRGFSYTCNQGIGRAVYAYIFLLNSDVELSPDYFDAQWHYFERPDTFGVMGRIMTADGSRIEDAARRLDFTGCRIKARRFFYADKCDRDLYTAYLSGANALVDATKLKILGGFDEIYSPFSAEDFDLSLRAWQLGWKCYYEHRSVCYHQVSGSTRTQLRSEFIKRIYYRNRFILQKIHLRGIRGFLLPLQLLFAEVLPKMLLGKRWIWASYIDYCRASHEIAASRKKFEELQKKYGSVSLSHVARQIADAASGPGLSEF